ncbi:MAG: tRNA pseudouridine synthase A, partial [Calditrichaeota bacterium]|nr:tRNA pseudouridine synthase A [Calditrichota bacterium]
MTTKQMSYRLEVEYDGTDFQGWQIQRVGRTVQRELESGLAKLFGEPVVAIAAGRTDAGVHATGQVVHFRTNNCRPAETVQRALNALLPKDIHIKAAAVVPPEFHARFGAHWRRYKYILATQPSPLWRRFLWFPPFRYDFALVLEATPQLLGRHDFASFCLSGSDTETTLCEVR